MAEVTVSEDEDLPAQLPPPTHRYLAVYELDREPDQVMAEFLKRVVTGQLSLGETLDLSTISLTGWTPRGDRRVAGGSRATRSRSTRGVHPAAHSPRLATVAARPVPRPHGEEPPAAAARSRWSQSAASIARVIHYGACFNCNFAVPICPTASPQAATLTVICTVPARVFGSHM